MFSRLMRIGRKRLAIAAVLMVAMGIVYQAFFADSHFDRFAKASIREFGTRAEDAVVSEHFNTYFRENGIADPVGFLTDEMESRSEIDMDTLQSIPPRDAKSLRSGINWIKHDEATLGPIKRRVWFRQDYFRRIFTFYTLIITITELRSGKVIIETKIGLTGL